MVLFLDGASHYSTSEIGQKWTTVDTTGCTFVQAAEGRADGCLKRTSTSNHNSPGYLGFAPLMTQTAEWTPGYQGTFGCALKVDDFAAVQGLGNLGVQSVTGVLFSVWAGSQVQFYVALNKDGTFTLLRQMQAAGNVILANSIQGLTKNVYGYVEIRWTLSTNAATADGSCQIRVNENLVLDYTGILFCATFLAFPNPPREWTSIRVLGQQSEPSPLLVMRMCDVYLADHVAPNGDFLGDIRIAYIRPDGIGAASAWTPLTPPNWSEVNEVPPDGDTSYVETTTPGTRDTYTFENVVGDPAAIQVCTYVRKTDAAGASFSVITRQGGVDYDGPAIGIGAQTYSYRLQPYDTNPATSAAWTEAQMNAGEWGPLKAS